MARIFVDKYGRETTEGPQEGVIGAATGTHSSAGLNSYQTNFGAVSRGDLDAPAGPPQGVASALAAGVQQPGGPGVAGAIAGQQPGQNPNDPANQVAGRWYRNDSGQWMQGTQPQMSAPPAANPYAGQFQDRPMTVQQMQARAMAGLPPLGAAQPPPAIPFPWASWIQPWTGQIGS